MSVGVLILLLVLTAIVAIVISLAFRRPVLDFPACGACRYNLTGCPSIRCPECGKLLIEAGVILPKFGRDRRRWIVMLLVLMASVMLLLAGLTASFFAAARSHREAAVAAAALARAQEAAARQQADATAKFLADAHSATSRPASAGSDSKSMP